ncbi:MAG: hypothetical protein ACOH2R_16315 [Pseudomonas sp.]
MISKGFIAGIVALALTWIAVVWGAMAYMDKGNGNDAPAGSASMSVQARE